MKQWRHCKGCGIIIRTHVWVVDNNDWCSPGCERESKNPKYKRQKK